MRGDIELMGVPPVPPPTRENPVQIKSINLDFFAKLDREISRIPVKKRAVM